MVIMDTKTLTRIAAELAMIQRDLSRLAADTSPTKDGAKALFEAYKKEHPGTEKTPKDFYEPAKGDKGDKPSKQSKKSVGDHDLIAAGDNLVLFSSFAKGHIKGAHNKPGKGSVFSSSVKDADIEKAIAGIPKDFLEKGGGVHEVKVPKAGYDLVRSSKEILEKYPNAKKVTVTKEERGKPVEVTGYIVDNDIDDFSTDTVSVVVRPTTEQSRQYLPEDIQKDGDMDSAIKGGKAFAVLSSWPGKGDVPPASQWGDDYAVIIPNGGKGADWGEAKSDKSARIFHRIASELALIQRDLSAIAEGRCWEGYEPVPGKEPFEKGSCREKSASTKKG
jgi:hypothetical protein